MVELTQPGGNGTGTALTVTDGITTVTSVSTIDFTGATVTNGGGGTADVTITGSGITLVTVTGTIDDSNVTFSSATLPTVLVINGAVYRQTGGAITWSRSGTTITLSVPVGTGGSIFGMS